MRLLATACVVALMLLCTAVRAAEGVTVLLRIPSGAIDAATERVRGQVSDLPVSLRIVGVTELEPSADDQVRAALDVGRREGAKAVVWFEQLGDGTLAVFVAASDSGDVLVRRVGEAGASELAPRSGTLETAAVVVRGALAALLETGTVGAPWFPRDSRPEPDAPAVRRPQRMRPSPLPPPRTSTSVRVAAGWLATVDGQTSAGLQGPLARVDLLRGRFGIGLEGAMSLPATLETGAVELRIVRTSLGADAMVTWPLGSSIEIGARAGGGAALFHRSTVDTPTVGPSPSRSTLSPTVALDATLSLKPLASASGLRVMMAAGPQVVLAPPRYDVGTPGGVVRGPALWMLQPRISLGLGWAFD